MEQTSQSKKIGIDLGGTKTEIVVLGENLEEQHRKRVATPAQDYQAILKTIGDLVFEADNKFQASLPVGIGTPGAISPESGLLRNSNTLCMNGKAFRQDIQAILKRDVRIENDANCFTLSEAHMGAAKSARVVFGVIIGTGTGGGLVIDQYLISGAHKIAGEWGHNPLPWHGTLDGDSDCYCGKSNCIETYLSGPGMAKRFEQRYQRRLTSKEIVTGAAQGDTDCRAALDNYFDQLARSLAIVVNIIDPDCIVLGGGMSNIDEIYRQIPRRISSYVFSDYFTTDIVRAELGDASGVFGAALL